MQSMYVTMLIGLIGGTMVAHQRSWGARGPPYSARSGPVSGRRHIRQQSGKAGLLWVLLSRRPRTSRLECLWPTVLLRPSPAAPVSLRGRAPTLGPALPALGCLWQWFSGLQQGAARRSAL